MSGTYSVSLSALENAVSNADQVGSNITRLLHELEADVQQRLAMWTGDAQAAYQAAKTQWDSIAAQMPATLTAARATLESIGIQYDSAERAAIATFGG